MASKPLLLVIGATGTTGSSIVEGLLARSDFRVAALVRPSSASKPATEQLRAFGVEIRLGDLADDVEKLKDVLSGVEVVISATVAWTIPEQKDIIRVAAQLGTVKRFVPCDFGTPGAKGVRALHDAKLEIHEYISSVGLPYTFIDVGWWMQSFLPLPPRSAVPPHLKAMCNTIFAEGDTDILLTDARHIGDWVARVVADPRTLNHSVIIWEDMATQNQAFEMAANAAGEQDAKAMLAERHSLSADDLKRMQAEGRAAVAAADPKDLGPFMMLAYPDYMCSMHVLGENTLESAKKLGYLDAKELYPDVSVRSLQEFVQEFYAKEEPGDVWLRLL